MSDSRENTLPCSPLATPMKALTSNQELQGFLSIAKNLCCQFYTFNTDAAKNTCFERFIFVYHCTNEYAKEKEKENMTIFIRCHGELLMTISNYLLNNMLVYNTVSH